MELGWCSGKIIGPVLVIWYGPILGYFVGMLLWSEYRFSEGLVNVSDLRFIGGIMNRDDLVSEDRYKVVTDNDVWNGMMLGFIFGIIMSKIFGIPDGLSVGVSESDGLESFDVTFG